MNIPRHKMYDSYYINIWELKSRAWIMFMIHSSMWDVKGTIKHCCCQAHILISFFNSNSKSHFRQVKAILGVLSHLEKWHNNNFFVGRVAWSLNRCGGGGMWEHIVVFTFIGLPMAMAPFTGILDPVLPNPQENSSFWNYKESYNLL